MAFEKFVPKTNKLPNLKPVYLRIAPGGSCYLSAGFRDLQPEPYSSLEFEYDPITLEFRFRVGKDYLYKVLSGAFSLPAELTRLITSRSGTRYNRMFYYRIIEQSEGWFTGEFVSVNKAPKHYKIAKEEKE
ncbi:hypothetical protein MOA67_gp046 [Klebsiella phage KpLz-2_45]|uniref:hypothetical protein n=1 Tax=Klebsiella phage KpLz-2_45 TaxID=2698923 RepID=UPI001F138D54|nr:hypothetical protein MOA67_gp046 [Klebsiella phage KpLz-2_45]UKS71912.1 hypothetical protein KpLz245_0460 [Klebsiella phage KpLz-2_45]